MKILEEWEMEGIELSRRGKRNPAVQELKKMMQGLKPGQSVLVKKEEWDGIGTSIYTVAQSMSYSSPESTQIFKAQAIIDKGGWLITRTD